MAEAQDIAEWLAGVLDEDERVAIELGGRRWYADRGFVAADIGIVATGPQEDLTAAEADHIARHSPASVLADIAAKRQIINMYRDSTSEPVNPPDIEDRERMEAEAGILEEVITSTAAAYSHRPGYRTEWRP